MDAAHLLFPGDAPQGAATATDAAKPIMQAQPVQDYAKAVKPDPSASPDPDEAARRLFGNDEGDKSDTVGPTPGEIDEALTKFDDLAESVRLSGDEDRALALSEASGVLYSEALEHGMPAADFRDAIGMIHEASGTLSPMTEDQIQEGKAQGMRELTEAGITEGDLNLARGLIREMSKKIPDLHYQLSATGLGNNPRFIRTVIKEARRRAGH